MKPNFALSLSFEGIRLLHRTASGWSLVGEVPLDSPDLGGELAMLRKTGLALDPAGLRTKLILPNDQVRYLALDTTRATEDDIRATLASATPYRIEELAWDMVRGGGRTYIAAVARETLDEAETFAADHRFGPVSFTAVPEEFTFIGEPFFGQTRVAETLLPPGERVERDSEPVRLLRPARPPAAPRIAAAAPAEPPPADPAPAEAALVAPESAPEPRAEASPDMGTPPPVTESRAAPDTSDAAPTPAPPPPPPPEVLPETSAPADDPVAPAPDAGAAAPDPQPDTPATADDTPAPSDDKSLAEESTPASTSPVEPIASATAPAKTEATDTPPAAPVAAKDEPLPAPDSTGADGAPTPPPASPAPPARPDAPDQVPSAPPVAAGTTPPDPAPADAAPAETVAPDTAPAARADAPADPAPTAPASASAVAAPAPEPPPTPASPPAETPDAEPEPVFSSRARAMRPLVADPAQRPLPLGAPVPPRTERPAAPTTDDRSEARFTRRTPPPVSAPPTAAPPAPAAPAAAPPAPPARLSIDTVATPPRADAAPRITGVTLGASAPAPGTASDRATVVPFAAPRGTAPPPPQSATARITALPTRAKPADRPARATAGLAATPRPRGKPRFLGLILTALLVIAMLVIALWLGRTDNVVSRFFGTAPTTEDIAAAVPVAIPLAPPVTETTTLDPPAETPPDASLPEEEGGELLPATDIAPASPEALPPDAEAAAAAAALVAAEIGALASADPATPAVPAADAETTAISPDEADRFYAATGVWLRAPRLPIEPESEDLAALTLSAMDAPPDARDTTALPPLGPDPGLVAQANPPPAGTRLPRDDRGFILATPEGTVTPDGLVIFAGSPAVIPPARPGTVAPEPEPVPAALPGQPLSEPPAIRPQARSAAFAASLPAEATSEPDATAAPDIPPDAAATAGAVSLAAFDGPRPGPRPASIEARAPIPFDGPSPPARPEDLAPPTAATAPDEAPVDPETALAATLASIVEGAGDPLASATPQAVAVARRPDARPDNFARVVAQQSERLERATAAAQEQSAPASLGTPEEAAETEAEEVEVAAAQPSGNVPRSVSEAATMENVMSLREINLIGVYGTPSDRRALVRLENGRYVRVSVGDTLDGGQVAAISDNSLNYVRRGRTITLEIPEG